MDYKAIDDSLVRCVTYPSFKQVPRVVDSADSACPAAACTVQSHTRKKYSKHTQPSKIQKKKKLQKEIKLHKGRLLPHVFACSYFLRPRTAWRRTPHERGEITALIHRRRFESCWVTEEPRETSSGSSLRRFYEETGCLPVWEAASVCRDEPGLGASCSVLTLAYMYTSRQPLRFYSTV